MAAPPPNASDDLQLAEESPPPSAFAKWMEEQRHDVLEGDPFADETRSNRLKSIMAGVASMAIYFRSYHHAKRLGTWKALLPISCLGMGTVLLGSSSYLMMRAYGYIENDFETVKRIQDMTGLKMDSSPAITTESGQTNNTNDMQGQQLIHNVKQS